MVDGWSKSGWIELDGWVEWQDERMWFSVPIVCVRAWIDRQDRQYSFLDQPNLLNDQNDSK